MSVVDQDMPLGRKVGLGAGHIVLSRDVGPPSKRGSAPNFRPMFIVAKRSPISAIAAEHLYKQSPYKTNKTLFGLSYP